MLSSLLLPSFSRSEWLRTLPLQLLVCYLVFIFLLVGSFHLLNFEEPLGYIRRTCLVRFTDASPVTQSYRSPEFLWACCSCFDSFAADLIINCGTKLASKSSVGCPFLQTLMETDSPSCSTSTAEEKRSELISMDQSS